MSMFHEGQRELQDKYGGRKVADRLEQHRKKLEFTPEHKKFVESAPFFFLATAYQESVDCSFKGGLPGFVKVIAPNKLCWPDYDGNRMYRSLGNILKNPNVGMLFINFDSPHIDVAHSETYRLRVNGTAVIEDEGEELKEKIKNMPGAKRLITVTVREIFTNCPRYIPDMEFRGYSKYAPRDDYTPPQPEWKSRDYIKDVLNPD